MTGATPTPERASDLRARVHLRPRTDADLPELVTILAEQQPYTGYPETWADEPDPLPLIKRPTELATWVANVDDRLVGHISITTADTPAHDDFHAPEVLWTDALNLPLDQLGLVSALFVANSVRGKGVGGLLFDTAVAAIQARGLAPVLEVVDGPSRAVELYRHRGWEVVGECRPPWAVGLEHRVLAMVLRTP
ncbi:MAG TPA: GNAT family N-acetyltransferase [Propionibacteriaceae bacterium]|nr:GNAT family N-acetyltransferase [Micropruina sp.]HBX82181.1 GNAT family N-acetyltransferase [Propionibacteriaceae bacterium]HBY21947.1 GNAT family N-acetyltransferase [Propionibacteriaceae bacterium]